VSAIEPAGEPNGPGAVAEALAHGELTVHGRIAGSSNATLLVTCVLDGSELLAVYKPECGERRLWDFPGGLWRREVAAYELGVQLGWCCVPETVVRREGPFGLGSIQRYVPEDGTSHYFTLRDEDRWERELVAICAFDVVANNADRKSGHVLLAEDRLFAIDNGLCFHVEPKLRTVIWDFASQRLPERLHDDLVRLKTEGPSGALAELLDDDELEALTERAEALREAAELPIPDESGDWPPYPWPLV